jgi:hypothetical protein
VVVDDIPVASAPLAGASRCAVVGALLRAGRPGDDGSQLVGVTRLVGRTVGSPGVSRETVDDFYDNDVRYQPSLGIRPS